MCVKETVVDTLPSDGWNFINGTSGVSITTCLEDGDGSPKQSVEVFAVADATRVAIENFGARARSGAVLAHAKFTAKQIHA